jgi:uncharacterized protein YqjF (DUF2071 family)
MLPQIRLVGRNVLFVHWPVDPSLLRDRLPDSLELDTVEGSAWVSVDLHELVRVGLDGSRSVPVSVPQLDFRTYVSHEGDRGVYFLTCDTAQRVNALVGARAFALPFVHADIDLERRPCRASTSSAQLGRTIGSLPASRLVGVSRADDGPDVTHRSRPAARVDRASPVGLLA